MGTQDATQMCVENPNSQAATVPGSPTQLPTDSQLFRFALSEAEKHKWIESEKAGHDIGFERALTDWIIKHRSKWRRSRQTAHAGHL